MKNRLLFIVKPLAIAVVLAAPVPAHAVVTMDAGAFKQHVQENMARGIEFVKRQAARAQELMAKAQNMKMKIDNENNVAANIIARAGKRLEDVTRLEQESRSAPSPSACSDQSFRVSLEDNLCSEEETREIIRKVMGTGSKGSPIETSKANRLAKAGGSSGSGSSGSRTSETPSSGLKLGGVTETARAWEDRDNETIAHLDKVDEMIEQAESSGEPALHSDYLLIGSADDYQFDQKQLEMALSLARIQYPPYVQQSLYDAETNFEVIEEVRKRVAHDLVNSVVEKNILLRTTDSDEEPSKLMAMAIVSEMMFDGFDEGEEMTANPAYSRLRAMLGSDVGVGEYDRIQTPRKAMELNQQLENLKSMLLREQLIASILLSKQKNASK